MKTSAVKMSFLAALLGVVAAQPPQQGSPVSVDMDKLTDFTASFRLDTALLAKNLQLPPQAVDEMMRTSVHGSIQANIGGERLKIKLHGDSTLPNRPQPGMPPFLAGLHEEGGAEFMFDGPGGFVSYRGKGTETPQGTPPFKIGLCAKVNFPQGLIPPPGMVKAQLDNAKPQLEQMLNMMPHTDATVDGDQVAIYQDPQGPMMAYVGVKESDGTPKGAGFVAPADGKWEPVLKFTEWEHGAGEITEIQCAGDLDSSALAADSRAAVAMQVFDHVMASLKGSQSLQPIFNAFPSKPSLMFKRSVVSTAAVAATALEAQPAESSSLFSAVAVAGAAGAFGGLVAFFALSKGSSNAQRVSLISDYA